MITPGLSKDVVRAVEGHKWERTDEGGIYIPGARVSFVGEYIHSVNGGQDEQVDPNLIVAECLTFLVNLGFHTQAKINNWYLALFAGGVTPSSTWTAANFASTASEIVSATEGYTQTNRPAFTPTAASANQIDNLTGGKAQYTIITATQLTVTGAALLSNQLKGATTGLLASASKFATARVLLNDDTFELGYRVTLNAV